MLHLDQEEKDDEDEEEEKKKSKKEKDSKAQIDSVAWLTWDKCLATQ